MQDLRLRTTPHTLGFIGIGIMGLPMATNLIHGGHTLFVHNRSTAKCDPLKSLGATVCQTPSDVATNAKIIFINVTDTPDVEAILFGKNGIYETAAPGTTIIDHSTISPNATEDFAKQLAKKEIAFLDAPVSGGDIGAQKGTLAIMVGGDIDTFNTIKPILEITGSNIVHMGAVGMGQKTKAVNQLFCALHMLACSEGILIAKNAGLDPKKMVDIVKSGAAGSWALSNLGHKITEEDYTPGFMIDLLCKDLDYVQEIADKYNSPIAGTKLATDYFKKAQKMGLGKQGTQGMIQALTDTTTK